MSERKLSERLTVWVPRSAGWTPEQESLRADARALEADLASTERENERLASALDAAEATLRKALAFVREHMEKEQPGELSPWAGEQLTSILKGE